MYKNANYAGGWAQYIGNDYDYSNNTFIGCGVPGFRCDLNDATTSIDNDGNSCDSYHFKNYFGSPTNATFG